MASASDFSGTWRGQLNLGQGVSIVLGFDISHNEDGEVNVLIDSPNQGMHDFPASSAAIKNNQLTIQSDELDAQFSGQLNNQKLSGEWKQGQAMPIELSRLASNDEQRKGNVGCGYENDEGNATTAASSGNDGEKGAKAKAKKRLAKGNSKNEKDGPAMLTQPKGAGAERGNPHHNQG